MLRRLCFRLSTKETSIKLQVGLIMTMPTPTTSSFALSLNLTYSSSIFLTDLKFSFLPIMCLETHCLSPYFLFIGFSSIPARQINKFLLGTQGFLGHWGLRWKSAWIIFLGLQTYFLDSVFKRFMPNISTRKEKREISIKRGIYKVKYCR